MTLPLDDGQHGPERHWSDLPLRPTAGRTPPPVEKYAGHESAEYVPLKCRETCPCQKRTSDDSPMG